MVALIMEIVWLWIVRVVLVVMVMEGVLVVEFMKVLLVVLVM